MPNLQSVVLTDRTSPTPVDHTFTPKNRDGGVGYVVESSGVPEGDTRLSIGLRQTPNGRWKAELKLAVPTIVTETINGVSRTKVDRVAYADLVFTFDSKSTTAERNNLVGMLASALGTGKVLVNDTVVKLEGVY